MEHVGLENPANSRTELERELLRRDSADAAAEERELADQMSTERGRDQRKLYKEIRNALKAWRSTPPDQHGRKPDAPQYFVDAAQGRGKSTLAKRLIAKIRSQRGVVLIAASTGLAALNFAGGGTAHSWFKIPVLDEKDDSTELRCRVGRRAERAELIRAASLIVWDELPMADVTWVDAVDHLCSDLNGNDKRPSRGLFS